MARRTGGWTTGRCAHPGPPDAERLAVGAQIAGNVGRYASVPAAALWPSARVRTPWTCDLEIAPLTSGSAVVETRSVAGIEIAAGERRCVVLRTRRVRGQ